MAGRTRNGGHVARRPLAEAVVSALPGPPLAWIAAWVLTAAARPRILSVTVGALGDREGATILAGRDLQPHIVTAAAIAISFFGAWLLSRRAAAASVGIGEPHELIRGLDSVAGPLAVSAVLTLAWELSYTAFSVIVKIVDGPLLFVLLLPVATFIWSYGSVLIGIDRLGRHALSLESFPADRSLGLRNVGDLALTGFAVYAAELLLYIVFIVGTTIDIVIAASLLVFGVSVFVLSMWRLHEQMVVAKARYVADARALYLEAFGPLRSAPTLQNLEQRAGLLGAAASLEARAQSIQEWPIDEAATRFLTIIVTGVVTGLVIQSILRVLVQ